MESFKKIFILYFGNTINYTEVESKSFKTTLYAIYSFFFFEKKRKGKERKKFKSIHKSLKTRGLYSCHQAVIWPTSVLVKFQSGPEAPTKSPPVYQVLRYPWRAFKSL